MDMLKKFASQASGKQTHNTQQPGAVAPGAHGQPAAGGQDYGDKAFSAIGKKFGYNGNAQTNEKVTDGLRGAYEKATGSKVNPKYSN